MSSNQQNKRKTTKTPKQTLENAQHRLRIIFITSREKQNSLYMKGFQITHYSVLSKVKCSTPKFILFKVSCFNRVTEKLVEV